MKEIPNWLKKFIPSELDNEVAIATQKLEDEIKIKNQSKAEDLSIQKETEKDINSDFKDIVEPAIWNNFTSIIAPRLLDTLNGFAKKIGVSNNRMYDWEIEDVSAGQKYRRSYVDLAVKKSLIELFNNQGENSVEIRQNYKFEGYTKNGNWSFGINTSSKFGGEISLGKIWRKLSNPEEYDDAFHASVIQEMARIIAGGGINILCKKSVSYGLDGSSTGGGSCDRDSGPN